MLDEVFPSRAFVQDRSLEFARRIELVIARKDDLGNLFPRVLLGHDVAPKNFKPAFTRPDLFP